MPVCRAPCFRFLIALVVTGACGAHSSSSDPVRRGHAEPATAYEEPPQEQAAIDIGAPTVASPELDTQPVQPVDVPTPIEGVLGNQWQCSGEVDAARLQSQLDAAAADFRACFVDQMVAQRLTSVDVQLIARVDESGSVTDHVVRSEPTLAESIACAEGVLRGLRLARPRGGNCVVLDYPLRFSIRY